MKSTHKRALVLVAPILLAVAGSARADATIDGRLQVAVSKGTKFTVAADVTMATSGTVTIAGTVAGTPYELTKKFKTKSTKTKTVKFVVDPRKLGVTQQTDTIVMTVAMSAAEGGQAEPTGASGFATLPPPMMIVPGLGNELPPDQFKLVFNPFRDALNENGGNVWLAKGKRATIRVQKYFSTSFPIEELGNTVAKAGDKLVKKSKLFSRIDLIGQSTGGLVIRQAMLPAAGKKAPASLAGDVRHVFFMGSPQSGTPVAYLAQQALLLTKDLPNGVREPTLAGIEAALVGSVDSPSAASLAALLLRPARKAGQEPPFLGVVELFLPTYAFAEIPVGVNTTAIVDLPTLTGAQGGTPFIPILADLNAADPEPGSFYHALYYSDVAEATGAVRTVDGLDLVAFVADGTDNIALISSVNGRGDGVASEASTLMTAHPAWNAVLQPLDLGDGLHSIDATRPTLPGYWNDPNVLGYILPRVLGATMITKQ